MLMHGSTYLCPPMRTHPSDYDKYRVFLGGSIEMGKAEDWQNEFLTSTIGKPWVDDVLFFNPRRPDWDSSWEQSIDCPQFKDQVVWELDMLEGANLILLYFDPKTLSPISLLELGIFSTCPSGHDRMLVCCPDGFWKKGNVDIVCERYGIECFSDKEKWLEEIDIHLNFT